MGACRFLHWLPPDDGTGKYSFTKKALGRLQACSSPQNLTAVQFSSAAVVNLPLLAYIFPENFGLSQNNNSDKRICTAPNEVFGCASSGKKTIWRTLPQSAMQLRGRYRSAGREFQMTAKETVRAINELYLSGYTSTSRLCILFYSTNHNNDFHLLWSS